jgi:glutathione S-transferase
VREAAIESIPDADRRAARRSVIEHGVAAPEFAGALGRVLDLLDDMDVARAASPWRSGDGFGLADAAAQPYVQRLEHHARDPAGDARGRTADGLKRVQPRPSYAMAVAEWAPAPVIALFRNQGEAAWSEVEPLTRR